jgi:hypothetical protein
MKRACVDRLEAVRAHDILPEQGGSRLIPALPEDLVAQGIHEPAEFWKRELGLDAVRQVYRDSPWWLTSEEEGDLSSHCRDEEDFCIVVHVYDLVPDRFGPS